MPIDLVISHYRVIDAIGEGGMGEVYSGIDETLRRKVALKSIRPEHRLDPATKARFLREARTLSQLDHPNICRVYDYIETADRDWIVLELVEGLTLNHAIQRAGDRLDRLAIAQQIAAVLVATHAAGVVHRDLKPGNLMITNSGQVRVLDFGLSATVPDAPALKGQLAADPSAADAGALEETRLPAPIAGVAVEASQFRSEAGSVKGTAAYMSPEQARGEAVTTASDMYSYGLVLQELFTGRRPYLQGLTYLELLEKRGRGESIEPSGMPAHLAALVRRLTALPPSQRPTAVETSERLRWIADAPKRLRRNLAVAGLLLAGVLGAVKYTVDLARERNAALRARDEADQRRGQAEGLIGFMVGDLRNKLTAVGRLEILDDIGKQALNYFASVPADTLTDEELYRRSQALHQLGQIRQARADFPGALTAYEESLAQAAAVVRRRPDNPEWQLGLGTSHFYAGDIKMRRGDLPGALAHFEAYKAIAERLVAIDPAKYEWRLELSYGHSNVAAIYSRQGNLRGAREQLEQAAAIQGELAKQRPDDAALQASRANLQNRLGIIQEGLGDLAGAAASFARELELYGTLLAKDPKNAPIRRRFEVSHNYRSGVMRGLGNITEAATHLQTAVREADVLVQLDPTNANWQRDLGVGELALGRLELEQGRTARAAARIRRSIDVLSTLAKRTPNRPDAQRDLAKAYVGLAETLQAQGDVTGALSLAQSASAIMKPIADKDAGNADVARDFAIAETTRGAILRSVADAAGAASALNNAVALLRPLSTGSSDRNLLDPYVKALLLLDRIDEARPAYEKLMTMGYREPAFMALWQRESTRAVSAPSTPHTPKERQ